MDETDSTSISLPHPIELEFFSRQTNKTSKLVNSSEGFRIEGVNRWYDFSFVEPVYITKIEIKSEGYDKWCKFEVEVDHVDKTDSF